MTGIISPIVCANPFTVKQEEARAETARIYVTNRGGTTIDVIDPKTNKVVHVIKGFVSPEVARIPVGEVPDRISTLVLP